MSKYRMQFIVPESIGFTGRSWVSFAAGAIAMAISMIIMQAIGIFII